MLIVVAAALLIALPSCNNESTTTPGPVAPKLERACFEPGDPERSATIEILAPREGQNLNPGSDLFVSWMLTELHGQCGDIYFTVEATYHNHPRATIFDRDMIADYTVGDREEYTIPDLVTRDNGSDKETCDLVCFWVTVHDDLGPIGEPEVVPVGPLTGRPTPNRIPQDRTGS